MFSKKLNEMGGWAGDNFVHWMSQVPTRKRYQSVNVLTGIAIPQPDSSPTAHQSMCWSCNVDKAPTRHGHALVIRTLRRMVIGTCGNGAKELMLITNLSNKIHNLRKSYCFVAQNGLISPLVILDTINCYMSYLPQWCMTGGISTMYHSKA